MAFDALDLLTERLVSLGVDRIFCKRLSENDNSKQQIYLGSGFDVLSFFPYGEVTAHLGLKEPNLKAPLELYWFDENHVERAEKSQIILYNKYPEVRLSGFLSGCTLAPAEHLQPLEKNQRSGGSRGVLVFGTTPDRKVLCYFAAPRSHLGNQLCDLIDLLDEGVFTGIPRVQNGTSTRSVLLEKLREISSFGPICSSRMTSDGCCVSYNASNAGGTTLEALLGIRPNSQSSPDFMGWEIKAVSRDRVTLMTPEPRYVCGDVRNFIGHYGHKRTDGSMYFTGGHRFGVRCAKTGLTLGVDGFDKETATITSFDGKVLLADDNKEVVASWSFPSLLTHWGRKHASAAYVKYRKHKDHDLYAYLMPITLGEGTNFALYLSAICAGAVVFFTGSNVEVGADGVASKVKARSQFRIGVSSLEKLYLTLTKET